MALKCETRSLGIKSRVWQEKIFLVSRIRKHEEDTLCRQIYEECKSKGWPGLGQEVSNICSIINIPDVNEQIVSKREVQEAIFNHHYSEMKQEINKMKKLEPIKNEDFTEVQNYFLDKSIENGRMSFKIRSQMLENIPGNFKNKFRLDKEKLKCQYCKSDQVMTQSHCLECTAWKDIKKDLDLTKIEDLVKFFKEMLSKREEDDSMTSIAGRMARLLPSWRSRCVVRVLLNVLLYV